MSVKKQQFLNLIFLLHKPKSTSCRSTLLQQHIHQYHQVYVLGNDTLAMRSINQSINLYTIELPLISRWNLFRIFIILKTNQLPLFLAKSCISDLT